MKNQPRYRENSSAAFLDDGKIRILLLALLIFLLFATLAGRLYYLQLYHGEEHRQLIAGQSIRRIRIPGWRGNIYSADGILFAGNRTSYDLVFYPAEMHQGNRRRTIKHMYNAAARIGRTINRREFPSIEDIKHHLWVTPGMPLTIFRNLTAAEIARCFEVTRELAGVELESSPLRIYPQGEIAAHIIGFARKADPVSAEDREDFFYYSPDMVGKEGVEKAFDQADVALGLRALPGRRVVQVNNVGFVNKELLGRVDPIHGNNVILTIDSKAQNLAALLLQNKTGAMVVLDADNGDIICAASSPSYSLSEFSPRLSPEFYRSLLNNPERPLINRAINGVYPPGSTIKPLICLGLLKAGIDPDELVPCEGYIQIGKAKIRCQAHRNSGDDLDMERALEKSCNTYMIHNILKTGLPAVAAVVRSAFIGISPGLEIPANKGSFPYTAKLSRHDIGLLSIGQGRFTVTPLQLAMYTAAIANGGTVYRPHIVLKTTDQKGVTVQMRKKEILGALDASAEAIEKVRHGMFKVVNSPGGSGRRGAVEGLKIHGKTGTAELGVKPDLRNITHFICFVEYKGRRYAAAITVEDGKSGGGTCAPIAAEFFRQYLRPSIYDTLEYD